MKLKYSFLAVLACVSSAALAEPVMLVVDGDKAKLEVYGRVQLTAEHVSVSRTYVDAGIPAFDASTAGPGGTGHVIDQQGGSYWRERNNRSVLGFRGEVKIDDDLKGVWQIESSAAADGGSGAHVPPQTWANRDSGVGLDSKALGRILLGSWQTPYTNATMNYDPFYTNTGAYMGIMGNGSGASMTPQTDNITFDRREHNLLQYWTPDMNGFKSRIGYELTEGLKTSDQPANAFFPATTARNPYLFSVDVVYDQGPLNAIAAYELHNNFQDGTGQDSGMKIGAAYKFGEDQATRVAVILQHLQYHVGNVADSWNPYYNPAIAGPVNSGALVYGDLKQNQFYLSVVQKLNEKDKLMLSYAKGGEVSGNDGVIVGYLRAGPQSGSTQITLGAEHAFTPKFAVFGYYMRLTNEANAFMDVPLNDILTSQGATTSVLATGLRVTW